MSPGWATVERLAEGRLVVRGLNPGQHHSELLAWIRGRRGVTEIRARPERGALEIRHSAEATGSLSRQLRDRLAGAQTAFSAPTVEIAHELPGRIRLQVHGGDADAPLRLSQWIGDLPGALRTSASAATGTILVVFDPEQTSSTALLEAIRASEASAWPALAAAPSRRQLPLVVVNSVVLAACVAEVLPLPALSVFAALTAIPSFRRALAALRERRASVDMLDAAAIVTSLGMGQPATTAFMTWLLSIGDLLLERTADRARASIARLLDLDAPEAVRIRGGKLERVAAEDLEVDDEIVVSAGGRLAADGVVLSGQAAIDEKALTGESVLRTCQAGDRALAATVVRQGEIVVRVERVGANTAAAKIIQIIEGAGAKPMTLQKNAEKVADRLVIPTFAVAAAAFALSGQVQRMASVLITDFGTGVRIAVPSAALAAATLAARRGVIVKGAHYLEQLAKTTVVVFDKTGTLTEGEQRIVDLRAVPPATTEEVLLLCAGAEMQAAHPIAEAILAHAAHLGLEVPTPLLGSATYAIGKGVGAIVNGRQVLVGSERWMGEHGIDVTLLADGLKSHLEQHISSLVVAADGKAMGLVGAADRPREESARVIRALQAGGRRRVVLLSGDARGIVQAIARSLGVDEAHGEVLPEEKAQFVRRMQKEGAVVAMVGDGINDAPALALADVGISLHGSTEVALETADVILREGGLTQLLGAFDIADQAMATVRRSMATIIVPNAIAIVLGALGLITPGIATLANNGSTVVAGLLAMAPLLRSAPDVHKDEEEQR